MNRFLKSFYLKSWNENIKPSGIVSIQTRCIENSTSIFPANIYSFKANNGDTKAISDFCSKMTIKTPERHWRHSGAFIDNFEQISHILVFLLLDMNK